MIRSRSTLLLLLLQLAYLSPAMSKGIYLRSDVNYSMAMGRQEFLIDNLNAKGASVIKYSFGQGFIPNISIGFQLNQHISFEVEGKYLFGRQTKTADFVKEVVKAKANYLSLSPSLRIDVPITKKIAFYSKTGIVLPVYNRIKVQHDFYVSYLTLSEHIVIKNDINIGCSGTMGCQFTLKNAVSLWLEMTGQILNMWTKSAKVKSFTINGQDYFSYLTESETQVVYKGKLSQNGNNYLNPVGINPNLPLEQLKMQTPFHNLGLGLGIAIQL